MALEFPQQIFVKFSNIKFHENFRPVDEDLLHADRRKDEHTAHGTNLIVVFCNFANAPKKVSFDAVFCYVLLKNYT